MAYGIKAVDEEPHGCPRWIMRIAIVCMAVFAIVVLRMVLGLGLAFAHYRTAQSFDSFVTERAVSAEAAEAWLPQGTLLASSEAWTLGEASEGSAAEDIEKLGGLTEVSITHGSAVLLDAKVEFYALVGSEDWERRAFEVSMPEVRTDPRMHAIIQVGVIDSDRILGAKGYAGGSIIVDALLVAGPGEDVFRVVELEERPKPLGLPEFAGQMLRYLFGLMHPSGELPEAGIMHHARGGYSLSWHKSAKGSSGLGMFMPGIRTNCHAFSYETKLDQSGLQRGGGVHSINSSWAETYSWNEKVW